MKTPQGYALLAHGHMITDGPRMRAYTQALREAVRPGMKVLDLGAGTAIFSLLACRFGADHVFAIEPDASLRIARDFVAANGCSDRVTLVQELSTHASLPDRVDLIVSDLRGVLPLFENHIPSLIDARTRFLAAGGGLIPQVDTMWAGLVGGPDIYRPFRAPWLENELDLDLSAGHPFVTNVWRRVELRAEDLLCPAHHWATLDYRTIDDPNADGRVAWTLDHDATAHGLALWFDTELGAGTGFSNAPGQPRLIYGQAFFPWPSPQDLVAGDRVEVRLRANLTGGDYTWRWSTRIFRDETADRPVASFDQSTFYANPVSPEQLQRREAGFTPTLDDEGRIDRYILSLIDSRKTLEEIARLTADRFPDRFGHWREALTRAGEVAENHGS